MKRKIFLCLAPVVLIFLLIAIGMHFSNEVANKFKGTQTYELAKAVMNQNESKIKKICTSNPEAMYGCDEELNYTVLHFAILYKKFKSAKALLEAGMSPDVQSATSGETPLYLASAGSIDFKFFKLLIDYGANPEIGTKYLENHVFTTGGTPLMKLPTMYVPAKKNNMAKAKYLIEVAGADVNTTDADGNTAAIEALIIKDLEMASYFICDLKADVTKPYYTPKYIVMENNEILIHYPVSILKDMWLYPLDSDEYKIKMKIVEEFERQGVDYSSAPTREDTLKQIKKLYPDTWEEYLKKY